MIFKDPTVFFIILFLPAFIYISRAKVARSGLRFSYGKLVTARKPTLKIMLQRNIIYLRAFAALFFIVALARPRIPLEETRVETEGIDIVLALDASGSMLAEDFTIGAHRYNRLDVVKMVVEDFIRARRSDRIGMVAFAARAYTVCPLTTDYDWLIENLERVKIGSIEDGTAIGSAIGSSLNRLKDTVAKSKIIILLTDGINNAGKMSPLTASEAAKALGVKIYTIGAGTKDLAPYPVRTPWGEKIYKRVKIEIDEDMLKKIADITGGQYYRATDAESLRKIYDQINALEKTPVEETGFQHFKELFPLFLIPGLGLLLVELVLSNTFLRRLP